MYKANHHQEKFYPLPDSQNLVIRFELKRSNEGSFNLTTPKMTIQGDDAPDVLDEKDNQHVLVNGNVPQILEYQKDKILLVVGQTL